MARWLSPRVAGWLLMGYVVAVALLVFEPYPHAADSATHLGHRLLADLGVRGVGSRRAVGFTLNVVLFVPLTFLAAETFRRVPVWLWAAVGFLGSGAIELTQLLFFPDRSASIWDLTANTLGAVLGVLAAAGLDRRRATQPSARQDG